MSFDMNAASVSNAALGTQFPGWLLKDRENGVCLFLRTNHF